jgi:hypothetical protein
MPFNYGTAGSIRDPRMAYAPRQVDGVTAYWQANPGRMVDTQTGMPLAERLAMIRGQQPAQQNYVYGDSYGQIQGQEQAIEQANFNRALALEQLRRQDQARAEARNERNMFFNQNQQLRRDQMLQTTKQNEAYRGLRAQELDLARQREMGLGARSRSKLENDAAMARMKAAAKAQGESDEIDTYGDMFSSDLESILPAANDVAARLRSAEADDAKENEVIRAAFENGLITMDPDNKLYKPLLPSSATEAQKSEAKKAASRANAFLSTGGKASETAAEFDDLTKRLDSIMSAMQKKGFYLDPNASAVIAGDREYRLNLPRAQVLQTEAPKTSTPPPARTLPQIRGGSWQSR